MDKIPNAYYSEVLSMCFLNNYKYKESEAMICVSQVVTYAVVEK